MIKNQTGWWANLPTFDLGWDIYHVLHELGFNIHVLTKGPRSSINAWSEKVVWCEKHLVDTRDSITITGDKGLVYGKVLVDDYPGYMNDWLEHRPRGLGIMPAHHYNKGYEHPNVVRYDGNNLEEVRSRLAAIVSEDDL